MNILLIALICIVCLAIIISIVSSKNSYFNENHKSFYQDHIKYTDDLANPRKKEGNKN